MELEKVEIVLDKEVSIEKDTFKEIKAENTVEKKKKAWVISHWQNEANWQKAELGIKI